MSDDTHAISNLDRFTTRVKVGGLIVDEPGTSRRLSAGDHLDGELRFDDAERSTGTSW